MDMTSSTSIFLNVLDHQDILTIPIDYVEDLRGLTTPGAALTQGASGVALLEEMLEAGRRVFSKEVNGKTAQFQCIHQPGCDTVKWLHVHTFIGSLAQEGLPGTPLGAACAPVTETVSAAAQTILSQARPDKVCAFKRQNLQVSLGNQTLVCCLVAIASVSLTMLVNYVWNVSGESSPRNSLGHDGDRMFLFDNTKAFAMMLVIFGHILTQGTAAIIMKGRPFQSLFFGMKMIQMPMFCLVSGICSQQPPTAKRVRALITYIALPAVIQIVLIQPLLLRSLQDPANFYGNVLAFVNLSYFSTPLFMGYLPWYLVALVLWRSSSFICSTCLSSSSALVTLVLISCIGGYLPSDSSDALTSIHESIGFLPYFAIGYVLPFNLIMEKVSIVPLWTRFAAAVCVLLWILGIVTPNVFPSHLPDAHKPYRFPDSMTHRDISLFWTWRLTKITVDIVPCLVLLVFVMPRGKTFLTQAGQHTLYAYLHHRPVVVWYGKLLFELQNNIAWMQLSVCGLLVVAMCHLVVSLAIMLFLTSCPWRWLFSWAVQPTWANPLMQRLIPDTANGK